MVADKEAGTVLGNVLKADDLGGPLDGKPDDPAGSVDVGKADAVHGLFIELSDQEGHKVHDGPQKEGDQKNNGGDQGSQIADDIAHMIISLL